MTQNSLMSPVVERADKQKLLGLRSRPRGRAAGYNRACENRIYDPPPHLEKPHSRTREVFRRQHAPSLHRDHRKTH